MALLDEGHTGVALFMTLSGYLFAKLLDGKCSPLSQLPIQSFPQVSPAAFPSVPDRWDQEYCKWRIATNLSSNFSRRVDLPDVAERRLVNNIDISRLQFYLALPVHPIPDS